MLVITKKDIEEIDKTVTRELIKSLQQQNHVDTKKLINSIESEFKTAFNRIELIYSYAFYGRFLETGIPASRFKKPPGRAEIKALSNWAKRKGLRPKKGKFDSLAWAIAKAKRKKGYPSPNSRKFSKTGKVTQWQTEALNNVVDIVEAKLAAIGEKNIDIIINDLINRITTQV